MPWPSHSATQHPTDWPAIRRRIRARDGGRCQVRDDAGQVCGSADRLQVDRIVPFSEGGTADDANLRLTCHAHHAAKTGAEAARARSRLARRAPPVHPGRRKPPGGP